MDHSHQQRDILATYFFLPEMFIYLLIKVINKFLKILIMRVSVVESRATDLKAISLPSRVHIFLNFSTSFFLYLSEIQLTGRSCQKDI